MSRNIVKNYQVNVGIPFQFRSQLNFDTIKKVNDLDGTENDEISGETPNQIENNESYLELIKSAKEEETQILEEAQVKALRICEEARAAVSKEIEVLREEAKKDGFEAGFKEAKMQYDDLLNEAEMFKDHAQTEYREILFSMELDIIDMVIKIAKKVISEEINLNKENILFLVGDALNKCSSKEEIILRISPDDFDFVVRNKEKLLRMVEGVTDIEIKKDSSLKFGACIIDTHFGSIDAGINIKLTKIEEAFKDLYLQR